MSSELAIRVDNLSKSFVLGAHKAGTETLAGRFASGVKRVLGRGPRRAGGAHWALRDVSLEIHHGDVVALIGRNGAGKSTLLKILARITDPTEGHAELHGRVGSLLEVGTGFHPELTGRENVYFSGAILGMRRAEIARDFDEIVAFAEVEKFIDTPIKHYSSGMALRLAFAVATQLRPEILLIDEVLAVGDAAFQRKCLQRIQDVGRGGRTIIFVSHSMAAVRALCRTGYVLDEGRVVAHGDVETVVDAYLARAQEFTAQATGAQVSTASFDVNEVKFQAADGLMIKPFGTMEILVTLTAKVDVYEPGLIVKLFTSNHERITGLDYWNYGAIPRLAAGERRTVGFRVERLPLLPGNYFIELELKASTSNIQPIDKLYSFQVAETPVFGTRPAIAKWGSIAMETQVIGGRDD
jgi:lipopolysaccharide transport system ATP-binding protein